MPDFDSVARSQQDYYGRLYRQYGYAPEAVGSETQTHKVLRYRKLCKLIGDDQAFDVLDIGMGLGHFYRYLQDSFKDRRISYAGSEVVKEFYDFCRETYPECEFYFQDISQKPLKRQFDYVVMAGTFYHKQENSQEAWWRFLESMLTSASKLARKGIAFNVLTEFCDYYRDELFYCRMDRLFEVINRSCSRFFTIDHAYPLYELTVCIYHESAVRRQFPQPEFDKWFSA